MWSWTPKVKSEHWLCSVGKKKQKKKNNWDNTSISKTRPIEKNANSKYQGESKVKVDWPDKQQIVCAGSRGRLEWRSVSAKKKENLLSLHSLLLHISPPWFPLSLPPFPFTSLSCKEHKASDCAFIDEIRGPTPSACYEEHSRWGGFGYFCARV